MPSKLVGDDVKLAREVIEAGRTHAPGIADAAATSLAAARAKPAHNAEQIKGVMLASVAALATRADELEARNSALTAEQGDDAAVFAARDENLAAVRAHLLALRKSLDASCGAAAVAAAGFVGETPADAAGVLRTAKDVIANLTTKPPRAIARGVRFNVAEALEGLPEQIKAFEKADTAVRRERREEQQARNARDEAWVAFDAQFAATTLVLEGFYRQAGKNDLADRLVPARRRAAGEKEPGGEGEGGGGEPKK